MAAITVAAGHKVPSRQAGVEDSDEGAVAHGLGDDVTGGREQRASAGGMAGGMAGSTSSIYRRPPLLSSR